MSLPKAPQKRRRTQKLEPADQLARIARHDRKAFARKIVGGDDEVATADTKAKARRARMIGNLLDSFIPELDPECRGILIGLLTYLRA
jgi:hypothetical protein